MQTDHSEESNESPRMEGPPDGWGRKGDDGREQTNMDGREPDFYEEDDMEEIGEATWTEVCETCCCHSASEWAWIFLAICLLLFFLYFFLLGLDLLATSAKVLGGCTAGNLLGDDTNPIAALMIGILATVLLQSSSTTTSIVVALVGAGSIPTRQAIYMVMGANIGTSVTNTIVAMGQLSDPDQLERAFAGATVHDMFNFMTVGILLPVEAITGYLYYLTKSIVSGATVKEGEDWVGPIKVMVDPLAMKMIIANREIIGDVAAGASCSDYYPVRCIDPENPTESTCQAGLIGCHLQTGICPAFFQPSASQRDDEIAGGVCFFIALVILVVCLIGLVTMLQKLLLGMSTRIIYKATNINGYVAMLVGAGITVLVQSSSITTSTLTPLVGIGVLQLEQMYPLTLGANVGTTITAILASLVADTIDALQVALAHLFFNLSGILLFYPIPFMRQIPIDLARKLGRTTRIWRGFPILYIVIMFFVIPLSILGLSTVFEQQTAGYTTLGSMLVIFIALLIARWVFIWNYRDGREHCVDCLNRRQRKSVAIRELADNMELVMAKLTALSDHTGLPEDEEDGEYEDHDEDAGGSRF
eukprot:CAMPEP_0119014222 /NCGR_PEP_ID=MMETSP1176-20130426/9420_1 /TAXON_ID=265551 /ORGANISM="Synedropsis recta cf, Strain CCMP1620" /LENGTH=587 /DNA_ID=CAMNT_0006967373 /DNA_START=119 /DNA_END=1882 /DNA_ORIENTATION=-